MRKRTIVLSSFFFLMTAQVINADVQALAKNHVESVLLEVEDRNIRTPLIWEMELFDDQEVSINTLRLNDFGYIPGVGLEFDEERLEQLASELAQSIDQPMKNPSIDKEGNITPGQARVILAESEFVDQVMSATYMDKQLILPIYVTEPTVSEKELKGIDLHEIGSFTTYFNAGVQGRSENVRLSAEAISDFVLGTGDQFSFNQVVGERTVDRGYQEAKEIVNKEFVMGIGGGICQTSSTLFNAVEAAGLEMVERYTHSREIGYVDSGRDATVSWGGPDFKFINPHPYPIILRSEVSLESGEITVRVLTNDKYNQQS
ncbi:VanW family protein [Bacillus sp. FJAT-45037]|uniref:VanW family protein n=1 Tax=Bacillus sp. FJAT-45037 TaxID=2011007 RepID=UPI000C23A706|nr:VanW family protein [Bacillus sp. FJAT-45037]